MIMPKVSIVIPVYNGENFLREAIESALNQSYKNKEVIVVNDGSTDGEQTAAIANSFGSAIRYFHKENGGVASALNVALRSMQGDFFTWLSHDDLISPNRIETDVRLFQANKQIRITFCKLAVIDGQGKNKRVQLSPQDGDQSP